MRRNHATEWVHIFSVCFWTVVSPRKFSKMRVAIVCVLLSLAALSYSQRPQPCIAPALWTGGFFQRDRNRRFSDKGVIFYDSVNQRIAFAVETEQEKILEIDLYQEKKRYRVEGDQCTVSDLTDTFRPIHIPVNATFLGEFYLGTSADPKEGVLVEEWVGNVTDPRGEYSVLVTVDGCVPVNDFFFDFERRDVFETFFFDIIEGILDPNIFVPPEGCP